MTGQFYSPHLPGPPDGGAWISGAANGTIGTFTLGTTPPEAGTGSGDNGVVADVDAGLPGSPDAGPTGPTGAAVDATTGDATTNDTDTSDAAASDADTSDATPTSAPATDN